LLLKKDSVSQHCCIIQMYLTGIFVAILNHLFEMFIVYLNRNLVLHLRWVGCIEHSEKERERESKVCSKGLGGGG
jgi:hypothetical protein